ncbi:hypothetical protein BBJ28_00005864, partial [Nothophytophthora sp. Chile5]
MAVDQFGFARGGDIARVMKAWLQNKGREKPEALWEIVGNTIVKVVKRAECRMSSMLAALTARAKLPLMYAVRRRSTAVKRRLEANLQRMAQTPDSDDGELHWNINIRVGDEGASLKSTASKHVGGPSSNAVKFRLGIHPPLSMEQNRKGRTSQRESKLEEALDDDDDDDLGLGLDGYEAETMSLAVNFALNPEITGMEATVAPTPVTPVSTHSASVALIDEEGIDLASSVERALQQEQVFFVLGELDQSLAELVQYSLDMAAILRGLGKRENRERAMRAIFDTFDIDRSGDWSLHEFNAFQQALGKEALAEVTLTEVLDGLSALSFAQFTAIYESYSAAGVLAMIQQLGIVLHEPVVKALGVLVNPLSWADTHWKRLLFFSRSTKDLSLELQFPRLAMLVHEYCGRADSLAFLDDPFAVTSWLERLEEFVQPAHADHAKDRPCRSIFCSLEREAGKTQQQWDFDNQSRGLPRGTSAKRVQATAPFLEMMRLVKAHVRGPEMLEVNSSSVRIVCEFDNLWIQNPSGGSNQNPATPGPNAGVTFLIAMEYPSNKKNPALLLPLARLYVEFGSFRGALAVCTLLVEGYPTSPRLGEAIFLSALTASALGRHRESAQYFQYLAEGQGPSTSLPHRLSAYQLWLLAALELARALGMRAHEREAYAQAYAAMVSLPPVLPSEKSAHVLYTTSRQNVEQRTLLWCRDAQTWMDLARRLAGPANAPLLVLSVLREARRRRMAASSEGLPASMLLLEGASLLRIGDSEAAESPLADALLQLPHGDYYGARHERFLLETCSASWCARFALEHKSAARLQAWQRRLQRLEQWRFAVAGVLEQRRNVKAQQIQCAWRGYAARLELQRLREQQREKEANANAVMAKHDDRAIALRLDAAARRIQALLHIARAKRTLRALRARRVQRETLLARFAGRRADIGRLGVFRRWRGFATGRKQQRRNAVVRIQRQLRAWRSRKLCQQRLQLRRQQNVVLYRCLAQRSAALSARVLQAWKSVLVAARHARDQAARRIQRRYRARLSARRYRAELRRHQAATATMHRLLSGRKQQMLLSSWRALATHALVRRLRKRGAAVSIQRRSRGVLARRRVKRIRARRRRLGTALWKLTRSREAQLLQFGLTVLRRNLEAHHRRRLGAVLRIQGLFRGFRSRQQMRRRRGAQALLNGDVSVGAGLHVHPQRIVLHACLLALAQNATRREAAARQLQRWWSRTHSRARLVRFLEQRAAQRRLLKRLQRDFHTLARGLFRELRTMCEARKARLHAAATTIQRRLRCWLLRRRYLSTLDRQSVAARRGHQAAKKLELQRVQRLLRGWRDASRHAIDERHAAAKLLQRTFRTRRAQRQARYVVAKKAAQARLLADATQKPLERCFRRWEAATLLEKSVLRVRSSSVLGSRESTPTSEQHTVDGASGSKSSKALTLEERAEVPSLLFFTLLNRVRQSGLCQLSCSGGISFKGPQLQQLLSMATSVIIDAGGGPVDATWSSPNLNEQVVDALAACSSSSTACPVRTLVLCNAPLRPVSAARLAAILQRSHRSASLALVSVVLANVPLAPHAVVSLACALAQSPSCLQQLVLERCHLGSSGAAALFEALTRNRVLWKLDLSGNHVADSACPALARALLSDSCALRVLALGRNDLSDRGVRGF